MLYYCIQSIHKLVVFANTYGGSISTLSSDEFFPSYIDKFFNLHRVSSEIMIQ